MNKLKLLSFLILFLITAPLMNAQNKYARFRTTDGNTHYGIVKGNAIYLLDKAPWNGGKETGKRVSPDKVKLLCPSTPEVILGLGSSYRQSWVGETPPKTVRWFVKPPSSAGNPGDDLVLPEAFDEIRVEVEMIIVIGKKIKNATPKEAKKAIFGYAVGNDVVGNKASYLKKNGEDPASAGTLLGSGLKIGDGFEPFGPYIYTGIDWKNRKKTLMISDAAGNRKKKYQENTSDMIYSPEKIVSDLSRVLTLHPGDIISSGTGKSFVAGEGDVVTISIEGMGNLTFKVTK